MTVDNDNTEIVKAVIAMAHSLNVRVIAEGVETIEQLQLLQTFGCDFMQGMLFSHPIPADQMTMLLSKGIIL